MLDDGAIDGGKLIVGVANNGGAIDGGDFIGSGETIYGGEAIHGDDSQGWQGEAAVGLSVVMRSLARRSLARQSLEATVRSCPGDETIRWG